MPSSKILLFFVMGIFLCCTPLFPVKALELEHKIYHMSPEQIAAYIGSAGGQRRVILLYASWCPYCQAVMPKMIQLEQFKKGSVIAVSIDTSPEDFALYVNKFKVLPFRLLLLDRFEGEDLARLSKALEPFGVEPSSGVPEMILMDEDNKVFRQGNFSDDMNYVAKFLFGKIKGAE